ncbi:SDR family NAD(P)-dependent oxidoreductase [Sphingomonas profundi]|uniref:SDR family NAD(P)-dependent oxidoreductase n=1 Tax=Alterirhizorhabdus profundi TaxID=2681549 RepID=UPI0018D17806|nr:SDR family NAD(P)-dependent oxidoreductase [Sphingomonas profundi]
MAGLKTLAGRTAVVTGGASGIGRGMAERFVQEGMNVVIADVEDARLRDTADAIGAHGVQTDVSDRASVGALLDATIDRFGAVHIVCNNAGIGPFGAIKDLSHADWKWMIDVNLWGVINGVETFLPVLLDNADGGWIVNTASMGGLSTFPGLGAYATTKFGVAALTETLAMELEADGGKVGATLLCPGPVRSDLGRSSRSRPGGVPADTGLADVLLEELPQYRDTLPWKDPAFAAGIVVDAIRQGELYAITHPEQYERVEARAGRILTAFGRQMTTGPA